LLHFILSMLRPSVCTSLFFNPISIPFNPLKSFSCNFSSASTKLVTSSANFLPSNDKRLQLDKFTQLTKFYCRTNPSYLASARAKIALHRSSLLQSIIGNQVGFRRYLRVRGVGYKFGLEGDNILTISCGLSHLIKYQLPPGMSIKFSRKFKMIRLQHNSLALLTGMMSYLRNLRKPDVYKGKGIRYLNDPQRKKQGKKKKV
jgi:large subunit ribosomal protein L6